MFVPSFAREVIDRASQSRSTPVAGEESHKLPRAGSIPASATPFIVSDEMRNIANDPDFLRKMHEGQQAMGEELTRKALESALSAVFGVSGGRPSATEFSFGQKGRDGHPIPGREPEMKRAKGRVIEPLALPEGDA